MADNKSNKIVALIFKIAALTLNLFNLIMFFSMRCCWSGISKTLGYENSGSWLVLNLPLLLCILLAAIALACVLFAIIAKKGKVWPIVFTAVGVVFLVGIVVIIILGATDYMRFIWADFGEACAVVAIVGALIFFIFVYPKTKLCKNKVFQFVCIGIIALAGVLYLVKFNINYISYEPVVYAVEDEYQIVFSSNANSLGWVTIDGQNYYDTYSGTQRSNTKIHKVCVPMEDLDEAKAYSISVQQTIYAGPFGGILGEIISKNYAFTPVDLTDGLTYFSVSDIHMHKEEALQTEAAAESKNGAYDFLVINGDTISDVETFADANYVNEIAFAMTGGQIPVIYARGNHEVKGAWSDQLYKFVGSKNEDYYYTTSLGGENGVYILVLDLGEDHDDDWWEYYTTADYDTYHDAQTEMIQEELNKGDYANYEYKLMVCHIPVVFVNYRHNHEEVKATWTELLNQFGWDMTLCGHQHCMYVFEPEAVEPETKLVYNKIYNKGTYGGYLTDFNFPQLMCSKPGYTQTDEDYSSHIGLFIAVDLGAQKEVCTYYNSNGEAVPVVNAFAEIAYGDSIEIDLTTGEWKHAN